MQIRRFLRHVFCPHFRTESFFSRNSLLAIEDSIRRIEATHQGEIVFAVEASLSLRDLRRGLSARERAVEVFSDLRVWDTELNNGVLLYLLLADKDIEIVADRGVMRRADPTIWQKICSEIESCFRNRQFEQGVLTGIRLIGEQLAAHYPGDGGARSELSNRPVLL